MLADIDRFGRNVHTCRRTRTARHVPVKVPVKCAEWIPTTVVGSIAESCFEILVQCEISHFHD